MKKLYLAKILCKWAETNVGPIALSWHDGQVGAMPVFDSMKTAREVYGSKVELIEIVEVKAEQ